MFWKERITIQTLRTRCPNETQPNEILTLKKEVRDVTKSLCSQSCRPEIFPTTNYLSHTIIRREGNTTYLFVMSICPHSQQYIS